MGTEAAALFVRVSADISDANRKLDTISNKVDKTGGIMRNALGTGIGMMGQQLVMTGISQGIDAIGGSIVGMNSMLEKTTLQFSSLGMTAKQADKHVAGLFEFAKKTPFETGPIILASKYLQQFGGSALNTTKNLTMIGDASAATGADISELSMWTGRLYAGLQAGKPVGEAMQRMQELGVVTPQVRKHIEDMQKAGAKGPAIWAYYSKSMGKFGNAMEKQAGTWEGLTSTLSDTLNLTLAKAGKPFFEGMKSGLQGLIGVLSSPAFEQGIGTISTAIQRGFGVVMKVVGDVWKAVEPIVHQFIAVFSDAAKAVAPLFDALGGKGLNTSGIGTTLATIYQTIYTAVGSWISQLVPQLAELGRQFVAWIGPMIPPMLAELANFLGSMVTWIVGQLPAIAEQLLAWASAFIDWIAPMIPPFLEQLGQWGLSLLNWIVGTGIPMAWNALVQLGQKFVAWVQPMVGKIPGALLAFGQAMVGWITGKAIPMLVPALQGLAKSFLDWIGPMVAQVPGLLVQFANAVITEVGKLPGRLWDFLTGTLIPAIMRWGPKLLGAAGDMARSFIRGFIDALGSLPGKIADVVRSAFAGLRIDVGPFHISGSGVTIDLPKIPGFATGAWNVPATGPALVHKGEMIIPSDIATRLRGGMGMGSGGGMLAPSGGGNVYVIVNIRDFHGTEDSIRELNRQLGETVRYATMRRSSAVA